MELFSVSLYLVFLSGLCRLKCEEIEGSFSIFCFCLCCCHHHLKKMRRKKTVIGHAGIDLMPTSVKCLFSRHAGKVPRFSPSTGSERERGWHGKDQVWEEDGWTSDSYLKLIRDHTFPSLKVNGVGDNVFQLHEFQFARFCCSWVLRMTLCFSLSNTL